MDTIFKAFKKNNQHKLEDLIKQAIKLSEIDFLEWAEDNRLFNSYDYIEYIDEHVDLKTYLTLTKHFEIESDLDRLAKYGQLDILKYYASLTFKEYPTIKGYKLAKENGHNDIVEWLDKEAEYYKY